MPGQPMSQVNLKETLQEIDAENMQRKENTFHELIVVVLQ